MTATAEKPPANVLPLPRNCTFSEKNFRALADYWFPVAYSDEVPDDKPFKAKLLDEELVIYRAGDELVVAKDLCIHRGSPLSLGWIEGCEIVCPYHGFRYGPTGACTRVPAQPNAAIPKKLRLVTFLSQERYGLIWVNLTGTPKRPIPEWPERENPEFKHVKLPPQTWKTSAPRQVENFNDVAHLSWLHIGTFGNRDKPEVAQYEVEETDYGLHFECPYNYISASQPGRPAQEDRIIYDYALSLPFFTRLYVQFTTGQNYILFDCASPVSAKETRVFFMVTQDFDTDAPEGPILEFQENVLNEDRPMVESQRPEEVPLDLTEEFHIRADRFSTYFRKALVEMGLEGAMTR